MKIVSWLFPGIVLLGVVSSVIGHRPAIQRSSCDNDYGSSTTALPLPDPSISWAFKHYLDCTHRAVWINFKNPMADFGFYVGAGVPPQERYADVRANAVIIGPDLPQLTEEEMLLLPDDIKNDPVWDNEGYGAVLHVSPDDQSTCDHLGIVMSGESSVVDGRCNFYEPFGSTNSWRILDTDENFLPVDGGDYYVAVYIQDDTSSKIGIALGTWVENFMTQYDLDMPTCQRDLLEVDFSEERNGPQDDCFPVVSCDAVVGDEAAPIGCVNDENTVEAACEVGEVCDETMESCVVAGVEYMSPMMGACGGERCPAAVRQWEIANMIMHRGMMDIEYTGNPDIDFVRGMIPHHVGAVDMCKVLLEDLTCTDRSDIDNLEGLVHFCNHIELEQIIEVGGMRTWLEQNDLSELAPCDPASQLDTEDPNSPIALSENTDTSMMMTMSMSESCGNISKTSSERLIQVNHKMHDLMAVEYSCDHSVDFVRMMLPHHAGAVDMCDILVETTEDDYLIELCNNITLTQRAEISWMYQWLSERDEAITAPCGECGEEGHPHDDGTM